MTIQLTYKYSDLDEENQFGLQFFDIEHCETYIRWVYFYLGHFMGGEYIRLYPFASGKVVKNYKFCNDAKRQATLIFNAIKKIDSK